MRGFLEAGLLLMRKILLCSIFFLISVGTYARTLRLAIVIRVVPWVEVNRII